MLASSMELFASDILSNTEIADRYYELTMAWTAAPPTPGQFLTMRVGEGTDPLLRRPFAYSKFEEGHASIVYERRGKTTGHLAATAPGDSVSVLGPLGNGFPAPGPDVTAVLVSGGVGIGPLLFFADALARDGRRFISVFGARSSSLLPSTSIEAVNASTIICTDDGSAGLQGTVVDGLGSIPDLSSASDAASTRYEFFVCGPNPMMEAVANFATARGIRCLVSMEQIMGCAVGACMGCAIRVRPQGDYARVCTEGPVFDAEEILW